MRVKNIFKRVLFIVTPLLSIFYSCSWFEPAKPVASYVHIDSFSVVTNYQIEGSSAHKITDAWVIYDNEYLGTFPLPTDIPLTGEGSHSLSVKAGIMVNGISASRAAYPKYYGIDTVLNLVAKQTTTIQPKAGYYTGTTFAQIEDFDDASLSMVSTGTGSAVLSVTQNTDPNAFEGNSGKTTLSDTASIFEVATGNPFFLSLTQPTYIELNYKGDIDFSIGSIISFATGVQRVNLVNVRASSTWKKIYVNMSDLGGVDPNGIGYKVYLHAEKPFSVSTADLYFDNLKVLY